MSQSIQIQVTQVGLEASIAAAMKRVGGSSQINLGTNSKQINALSQPLGRITGQADEFSKSMAAANARVLAFGASASIIAGVSMAMSGLLSSTIKVEKSLVEIGTVLNSSGEKLDKFGQDIFNVAKNTGKSFSEVATGALELARQGLSAEDTLARLNDAMILSRLSGLDAAQSVQGLTAAFNSFKSSGISTAEILNKVVAAAQSFAVSEKDIIEGLGRSASIADLAGVSFNELAAIITAIQEKTARGGAVIGNSLKTIFARIQDRAVISDLDEMGITVKNLQGDVLPALKILENLAAELGGFSQIEQADISKKLGGIYQLDKLLAALMDLSSESSVYRKTLEEIGISGDKAYKKNAVLNETLASIINKVAVSAEQLGAKLGEIGVTDSLKNILGFFNSLLEGIQKVLGEESGLGTLVKGLVKGLGNFFAGPGLALFGAIILKLSKDLVMFGFASLKAFFGIGKAAKDIQNVQSAISQVLARNVDLQQKLFQLEGNRAGQLKVITGALVEQEALLRKSANISSGLAAPLYNVGVRASDSGLRIKNKAGGYMPAVAKESQAINSGVGGARRGDKPVVMPNFNFGQGKKGTVVAHTGEYVVPNFGGGKGSAIFNRDMVQKMGLPDGARKITASGGLIPNFKDVKITKKVSEFSSLGRLVTAKKVDSIDSFTSSISPIEQTLTSAEYTEKAQKQLKEIIPKFGRNNLQINQTKLDQTLGFFKKAGVDTTSIQTFKSAVQNLDVKRPTSGQFLNIQNRMKGILGEIDASEMSGQKLNQGNSFLDLSDGSEVKTVKTQKASEILKKGINQYLLSSNIYDGEDNKTQLGKIPVYLPKGTPLLNSASGFIPNFESSKNYLNEDTGEIFSSKKIPTGPGNFRALPYSGSDVRKAIKAGTLDPLNIPQGISVFRDEDGNITSAGYPANILTTLKSSGSAVVIKKEKDQETLKKSKPINIKADDLGGIALISPVFGGKRGSFDTKMPLAKVPYFAAELKKLSKGEKSIVPKEAGDRPIILKGIQKANTPSGRDLQQLQGDITEFFSSGIVDLAYRLYGDAFDPASGGGFATALKSLDVKQGEQLLPPAAQGSIFEAAGKVALSTIKDVKSLFGSADESRPFDFQNKDAIQKVFKVDAVRGEAKRGGEKGQGKGGGDKFLGSSQVSGLIKKVFNDQELAPKAIEILKGQGVFDSKAQAELRAASKANAAGGFIPNFAKVGDLVKNFSTTLLPKLNISKISDKRLLEDDSVNLKGNIFQKMFVAKKLNEDNKTYEARIRKQLGYKNSNSLFGKDNSAIDGFKSGVSFLEVKGGKYDDRDVKLKFLRANIENYGTGNPLDVWTENKDNINVAGLLVHNNEKEKYATGGRTPIKGDFKAVDKIRANKYGRPLRFAAANGFIPNFAKDYQSYIPRPSDLFYHGSKKDFNLQDIGEKNKLTYVTKNLDHALNYASPETLGGFGSTSMTKSGWIYSYRVNQMAKIFDAKNDKNLKNLGYKGEDSYGDTEIIQQPDILKKILDTNTSGVLQKQADRNSYGEYVQRNVRKSVLEQEGYKKVGGKFEKKLVRDQYTRKIPFDYGFKGTSVLGIYPEFLMPHKKFTYDEIRSNKETRKERSSLYKKIKAYSGGFVPNFANPLQDAVGREMAAGVPASQIYVDKNSSLKNAMNPMGLMVANRRDEPAGGFQGINRARKEGANPMMYGAASGFVPNFKKELLGEGQFGKFYSLSTRSKANVAGVKEFKMKDNLYKESASYQNTPEEYAISKFLSENTIIRGITAPKVIGSLKRSVEAGRIGKSVISDPLASTAIGETYSFRDDKGSEILGTIMEDLLNEKGLRIQDLHGKNYTINNIGSSFVKEDGFNTAKSGNSPNGLDMNSNREYFNKFANTGGMVNILDPAMFSVSNPAIESKIKELSTIKKGAASGFVPNFASYQELLGQMGPYNSGRVENNPSIAKRLKALATKQTDLEYLGSGAEAHAFKSSGGDVYKLPVRAKAFGYDSAREKTLNSNYFPFDEANKQLIANGSNLRFPLTNKQSRSVITSQKFAGPVLPQVINDPIKSDGVVQRISKEYERAKGANTIRPNLLSSFGLDLGGGGKNFTFFNPLSEAQKSFINSDQTSTDEVFKKNVFGLIDPVQYNTKVAEEYKSKAIAAKKGANKMQGLAGGYLPNFAKNKLTTESGSSLSYYDDAKGFNNIQMLESNKKGDGFNLFNQLMQQGRPIKTISLEPQLNRPNKSVTGDPFYDSLLSLFPQLKYRMQSGLQTSGMLSVDGQTTKFPSLKELRKLVKGKDPSVLRDTNPDFISIFDPITKKIKGEGDSLASGYIPNFAVSDNLKTRGLTTPTKEQLTSLGMTIGEYKKLSSRDKDDADKAISNFGKNYAQRVEGLKLTPEQEDFRKIIKKANNKDIYTYVLDDTGKIHYDKKQRLHHIEVAFQNGVENYVRGYFATPPPEVLPFAKGSNDPSSKEFKKITSNKTALLPKLIEAFPKPRTFGPSTQFRQLQTAQNPGPYSVNHFSDGFIPNFANPLQDAVGREMAAGVPASQIYIDKNSSLKNAMNPMGLMVANRRDEPAGGFQGINRARREGANPMMYGAAGGFVPNYASLTSSVSKETGIKINPGAAQQAIDQFAKDSLKAGANIKKLAKSLQDKLEIITQENVISKQLAKAAQEEIVKKRDSIANRVLESNANKKIAKQLDKVYLEYNKSAKTNEDLRRAEAKAAAVLNKTSLSPIKQASVVGSTESLAANRASAQPGGSGGGMLLGLIAFQSAVSIFSGFLEEAGEGGKKLAEALQKIAATALIFGGIAFSPPIKKLKEFADELAKTRKAARDSATNGYFKGYREGRVGGNTGNLNLMGRAGGVAGKSVSAVRQTASNIGGGIAGIGRRVAASPIGQGVVNAGKYVGGAGKYVGSVAGATGKFVGGTAAALGGLLGPAVLAVGIFKIAGQALSGLRTYSNSAAKSLAEMSIYAGKATASLSELDKAAIKNQVDKKYGASFDTVIGSLQNILGISAMASGITGINSTNTNYKSQNLTLSNVSEEQFKGMEEAFISSYVGANRTKFATAEDAAGAASKEFGNTYVINGSFGTSEADSLKDAIKKNSAEAQKKAKETLLAEALKESAVIDEMAEKDVVNFNEVLKRTVETIKDLRKNLFELESRKDIFKGISESAIENAYNLSEYDKTVQKLTLSLEELKASSQLKTLDLQTSTRENLINVVKENIRGFETLSAGSEAILQDIQNQIINSPNQKIDVVSKNGELKVGEESYSGKDVRALLTPDAVKVIKDASEEYVKQNTALTNQNTLAENNLRLETLKSAMTQKATLALDIQTKQFDIQKSSLEKIFDLTEKIRNSTDKISDLNFERGLIGATQTQRLSAQIGRTPELKERAREASLSSFKQDRVGSVQSLESLIPSTLSSELQFSLKSGILKATESVRAENTLEGVSKKATEEYNETIKKINKAVQEESKNRQGYIDQLQHALVGSSVKFENTVIDAAKEFKRIAIEAANLPLKNRKTELETRKNEIYSRLKKIDAPNNPASTSQIAADEEFKKSAPKLISLLDKQIDDLNKKLGLSGVETKEEATKKQIEENIVAPIANFFENLTERFFPRTEPKEAPKALSAPPTATGLPTENASEAAKALESARSEEELALLEISNSSANAADELEKLTSVSRILGDEFKQLQEGIPAAIAAIISERNKSISGAGILGANYDLETQRQLAGVKTQEERDKITRDRQNKGLGQLFAEEYGKTPEEQALDLKKTIVDGSVQFKNNMIEAIMGAAEGTTSLKDGLRSAAYEFVKSINQKMMSNLIDKIVGGSVQSGAGGGGGLAQGIGSFFSSMFASGGMVNGGSGSKDDVPAMLMGGEYVVNKKAVSKYGAQFLESVNNGTLTGYAQGGMVASEKNPYDKLIQNIYEERQSEAIKIQGGNAGFYTPGTYNTGAILGKRDLLSFATQTGTTGQFDKIVNQSGYQAIDLEPESSKLSVSGMRNSPQFEATQSAKQQAFDLYLQQYNAELEAAKAKKEQKKAFRKQLLMLAISAVAAPVLGAAGAGFGAAFKGASGQGLMSQLGAGAKGIFTGGTIGGQQVGGLGNLFSSAGKAFTGDFAEAGNQFKLSQIGNDKQLTDLIKSDKGFASYIDQRGGFDTSGALKAIPVSEIGGNIAKQTGSFRSTAYGLASIDKTTAMDQQKADAGNPLYKGFSQTVGASGRKLIPGYSVASNYYPLGTILNINGKEYRVDDRGGMSKDIVDFYAGGDKKLYNQFANMGSISPAIVKKATGGMIPSTSGIDTVPAMLSGGEFVMNRSAVQGIGSQNLQSMNSGGTSVTSEETSKKLNEQLLAKLDELISASGSTGDITINVTPSGQSSQENSQDPSADRQQFARKIKDAVLQIINDEKRIGGSLRR